MNATSYIRSTRALACAAAALVLLTTPTPQQQAHACSVLTQTQAIWPVDATENVSIHTHIWTAHSQTDPTARLTFADTGEDVPLVRVAFHNDAPAYLRTFYAIHAPTTPLVPNTRYTVYGHDMNGAWAAIASFNTGDDRPLPPAPLPPTEVRYTRSTGYFNLDSCSDPINVARRIDATLASPNLPTLYGLSTDTAHAVVYTGPQISPFPSDDRLIVAHDAWEESPLRDVCVTLDWIDPFGRRGQFDTLCAPDACRHYSGREVGFTYGDTSQHTQAQCDLVEHSALLEPTGCTVHPSRRPSRLPIPLLAPVALLLIARRLRRGHTTP